MKQRRNIIISIILIVILAGGAYLAYYLMQVKEYKDTVNGFTFEDIDISKVPDGTYVGECDVKYIYAKVEVSVKDGKLMDIKLLEHKNERGKAAEGITGRIIEEQRINVDAISGATNSSKVIKKAVENALANK